MRSCILGLVMLAACAPQYVGAPSPVVEDSVVVVIQNNRDRPLGVPHFYLDATGRLLLGAVEGFTQKTVRVARSRLSRDGCMSATAHYAGAQDYHSAPFCWTPGMLIDIRLNQGGELLTAWAHR